MRENHQVMKAKSQYGKIVIHQRWETIKKATSLLTQSNSTTAEREVTIGAIGSVVDRAIGNFAIITNCS